LIGNIIGAAIYLSLISPISSLNWAGQVVNTPGNANFGVIAATWVEPAFKPNPNGPPEPGDVGGGADAIWVGLGGMNGLKYSGNLCQAGTLDVEAESGQILEYLVAEDYPKPAMLSSFTISPGDTIMALVGYLGGIPAAMVTDLTTGQSLAIGCSLPTGGGWDSAEWVMEAPTFVEGPHAYLEPVLEPNPQNDGVFAWQSMSLGLSPGHGWPAWLAAQAPSVWMPNWQTFMQPMNMVWPLPIAGESTTQLVGSPVQADWNGLGPDTATITWQPTPYSYRPIVRMIGSLLGG